MRYAARTDANHKEILAALRKCGWFCHDSSGAGNGFPDITAARGSRLELIEVKGPKGKLTPEQLMFHAEMKARGVEIRIIRSAAEAAKL